MFGSLGCLPMFGPKVSFQGYIPGQGPKTKGWVVTQCLVPRLASKVVYQGWVPRPKAGWVPNVWSQGSGSKGLVRPICQAYCRMHVLCLSTEVQFSLDDVYLLSQPDSNTKRSWGDHIIEWNPPHPTTETFKALQGNPGS